MRTANAYLLIKLFNNSYVRYETRAIYVHLNNNDWYNILFYSKYLLKFFKSIHSNSRVSRRVAWMIALLCYTRCSDILTFWTTECGIQYFYIIILLQIPAPRSWSTIRSSISSKYYTKCVEVRDRCRHHLYGGESDGRTLRVVQGPRATRLAFLKYCEISRTSRKPYD